MHKAKTFFYVCAGLFLLALSYNLGARSAGAQAGGSIAVGDINMGGQGGIAALVDRLLYRATDGPPFETYGPTPPIPGTEPIVAVYGPDPRAMLANGDVYRLSGSAWILAGNVLGSGTPAQRATFGALKKRYRGVPGATQPVTQRP